MIQKIIDILYRKPKSQARMYKRFGGYLNYRTMLAGMEEMKVLSQNLKSVSCHSDGLTIYFLTGKKFLYQTLFCIQSLVKVSNEKYNFVLVDDGSFDEQLETQINQKLPGCRIVRSDEITENINRSLPSSKYPYLHIKRKEYPHIKKLTDVHTLPYSEWKVVIDSDMLFWNLPTAFINWLKNPSKPIFMLDCEESYGYSRELMTRLCGSKVHDLLNVGIIGLNSKQINWDNIESWSKEMEAAEGKSYFLEQALSAMIIGDQECEILPKNDYIVNPTKEEVSGTKGTLHHYVDLSKEHYFKIGWKKILQ